ncbi:MAG TPA: heme-binding protein [Bacteriovoracaceae bacterium]|nr:heme-binding protein [Bacteriovoracaceae bacterium]
MFNSFRLPFSGFKKRRPQKYKVLLQQGPVEIRMYPKTLKAKLSVTGNLEEAFTTGFKTLKEYLNGNNFKVKKMPITGPVLQIPRADGWELDIFLPANMDPSSAPKPINRFIKFEAIPQRKVAVMSHYGTLSQKQFEKISGELQEWLHAHNFMTGSVARVARFTKLLNLPIFFKQEIQIDVN